MIACENRAVQARFFFRRRSPLTVTFVADDGRRVSRVFPPADLPEAIEPPPWLPFVFVGIVGLIVLLLLRRRKNRPA